MSNKQKPSNPDPKKSTSTPLSRREQLAAQKEKEAREKKVLTVVSFSILGVAVLAIAGVVVWAVLAATKAPVADGGGAATGDYTIVVGQDDAPVTLAVYQDYMCPYCGQFERANRDDLESMVDSGTAKIEFHLMNFLDSASQGSKYSTRAANALVAVAKAEPDKVMAFNALLYDNQPEENSGGLSDSVIADLARQAGVGNDVIATFAQLLNADFVNNSNTQAFASGVTGTPTVKINGEVFSGDVYSAGPLLEAVQAATAK